jgi:hypothetical protein
MLSARIELRERSFSAAIPVSFTLPYGSPTIDEDREKRRP